VKFIHYQKPQGLWAVSFPQRKVPGPYQEVIKHLVVREQNVRRCEALFFPAGDDAVFGHDFMRVLLCLSHEEPRYDLALQLGVVPDGFCDTARLVSGQSVHGINQDNFYTRLTPMSVAMFQHGPQKAFGLTGTRTCCNKSGSGERTGKSLEGLFLVQVGRKCQGDFREEIRTALAIP